MTSKPMVIVIATATSVCGVSAAIAAAAASKAKKDDLTFAVGLALFHSTYDDFHAIYQRHRMDDMLAGA